MIKQPYYQISLLWVALSFLGIAISGCVTSSKPNNSSIVSIGANKVASIARGGRLYDKWFKVLDKKPPLENHSAYPATSKYAKKNTANWRCKECHGWDGMGKDGSYSSGKHFTGISGVRSAIGQDPATIIATLKAPIHGYGSLMEAKDLMDLASFLSAGQVDMDALIDRQTKKVKKANTQQGAVYYQTLCAQCHGKEGIAKSMPVLGKVSNSNPWETLHKILNGQPDEEMPALRGLDHQISLDIIAYLQTLPITKDRHSHEDGHRH
jgi:mono/diheme cytochrome c family protein